MSSIMASSILSKIIKVYKYIIYIYIKKTKKNMASISPSIHQVSVSSFFHHFSVFVVFTGPLEVQTFCKCPLLPQMEHLKNHGSTGSTGFGSR
jgi:hypothetical protein